MSSHQVGSLSHVGKELGQFLLICALAFGLLRLVQHYWQDPLVMLAGSSAVMAGMLLVKRDLAVTVAGLMVGVIGPLFEIQLVDIGALTYAAPHLEGIPAWLFMVWGAGGIFIACLHQFIRVLIAQTETPRIDGD